MDRHDLDRGARHIDVPQLQCEIVPRYQVPSAARELHVRNGRNDLGEKRFIGGLFLRVEVWFGKRVKQSKASAAVYRAEYASTHIVRAARTRLAREGPSAE